MVIPTYIQLRTTVNLMSRQSTQRQPTQAVDFLFFFIIIVLIFFFPSNQRNAKNILEIFSECREYLHF